MMHAFVRAAEHGLKAVDAALPQPKRENLRGELAAVLGNFGGHEIRLSPAAFAASISARRPDATRSGGVCHCFRVASTREKFSPCLGSSGFLDPDGGSSACRSHSARGV